MRALLLATLAPLVLFSPPAPAAASQDAPPARDLLHAVTSSTRLAGTRGSVRAADLVTRVLEEAGFEVERDTREVLLSLPRRTSLEAYADGSQLEPFVARLRTFDPDALPPGDVPPFHAFGASGTARGPVVDCGYGMESDFEALRTQRIDLRGKVALCRYGKGYRGAKVARAQAAGAVAVLLWTDPVDAGAPKGATWPEGPWMPTWAVQRGTVAPVVTSPGDPSTPGFASPAPGQPAPDRLTGAALDARLPRIPSLPITAEDATRILDRLRVRRVTQEDGTRVAVPTGPGPVEVRLEVDAPRELRPIHNVIARLPGQRPGFVLAGNHRDAWVRGAHDAGSGTVGLLRAAQHLGARVRDGWTPRHGIALAFWDAEEMGLLGSTEWGEANAASLADELIAYVNCDALVSGTTFHASGTPGLESVLATALRRVPHPAGGAGEDGAARTLLDQWVAVGEELPRLALPGSGSDFAVFLHHLALPVLDLSFRGNTGGHYHSSFDDVPMVERFLDPGYVGHELAGAFVAELLAAMAEQGRLSFQDEAAARELARHAAGASDWLGEERAERLATAFDDLARACAADWDAWAGRMDFSADREPGPFGTWPGFLEALEGADERVRLDAQRHARGRPRFLSALAFEDGAGLDGRPWQRNRLWAPDARDGYGTVLLPELRQKADSEEGLDAAVDDLIARLAALRERWESGR